MTKPQTVKVYDDDAKEIRTIDVSDKQLEKVARGFILGTQTFDDHKELKAKLETRITKKIGVKGKLLTDKLFELVEGIYIVKKKEDGSTIKYYLQPPNLQAIIYAIDRVLGKPTSRTEHTETKKGVVLVEHIIKGLATNPEKRIHEQSEVKQTNSGGAEDIAKGSDDVQASKAVV